MPAKRNQKTDVLHLLVKFGRYNNLLKLDLNISFKDRVERSIVSDTLPTAPRTIVVSEHPCTVAYLNGAKR